MDGIDPLPLKNQLSRIVEGMDDWQVRLVLSFVKTLFGSEPTLSKDQTEEEALKRERERKN